jgi:two-component sensor histidine kinase
VILNFKDRMTAISIIHEHLLKNTSANIIAKADQLKPMVLTFSGG